MTRNWSLNQADVRAIEILEKGEPRSLTELVQEIYGIESDADRHRKINAFKKHLDRLVADGFLSTSQSKNDMNRLVTVYSISENVIIGKGGLLIVNDYGMDFTELGKMIKVVKEDGKDLVLPLTI
jgi:predicted ArsR family transcriptional regulator